jgi:hypothetical protein
MPGPRKLEQEYGVCWRGVPTTMNSQHATVNPWSGFASIASGSVSVTVSTALVTSDSIILVTAYSATDASSGKCHNLEVKSIVDGTSFIIGTADSQQPRADTTTVAWLMFRTK